ncbi:MAG: DUF2508 domain-containing protein [Caldibacillus debilis]|jgi:hypothetical protein|uniref:DUF2508 domain-containing protein n=1 Tax=Caldibacillus debilis TaxID=301148 RepID=A0A3E0K8I0_9BACI|nr:YaaL family protein [Caldibacillus debilis]MBO2481474.1 DUF2508 domain-containing protein [Bacillaceae bacterium]MBY6270843.1 DUF2508 domain-containing protein [Bacillaceae bacterium]OUM88687.1 MAG: hypothetical protein BAA03_01250 [Caldibacillus debilis]REJ19096.1 MAG: DUF2508 domain-containing protein [Caldibacillus debilis]REJ23314.1 MAG: DUF2508 domain-containing protein [Caldibacillus debilis]
MLFNRKNKLKKEFDGKLLQQMEQLKNQWHIEQQLWEKSFYKSKDLEMKVKLAELKYFYLFKEAKHRNIRISPSRRKK